MKGTTALMRCAQEGYDQIADMLINSGKVEVNRKNHDGMNALMLSSQRGHGDTVKVLIKAGAVMDERTSQGSTALMLACKRGHEEVVKVLVSMGAEIYIRDQRGRTASDTAVKYTHTALLKWLNTELQLKMIRELKRFQRSHDLLIMRDAYLVNQLKLSIHAQQAIEVYKCIKRSMKGDNTMHLYENSKITDIANGFMVHNIKNDTTGNFNTYKGNIPKGVIHKAFNWDDWYWVVILYRYIINNQY